MNMEGLMKFKVTTSENQKLSKTFNGGFRDDEINKQDQNSSTIIGRKIDYNGVILKNSAHKQYPLQIELGNQRQAPVESIGRRFKKQDINLQTEGIHNLMDLSLESISLKGSKSTQMPTSTGKSNKENTFLQNQTKTSNSRDTMKIINDLDFNTSQASQDQQQNYFRAVAETDSKNISKKHSLRISNEIMNDSDSLQKQTITSDSHTYTSDIEGIDSSNNLNTQKSADGQQPNPFQKQNLQINDQYSTQQVHGRHQKFNNINDPHQVKVHTVKYELAKKHSFKSNSKSRSQSQSQYNTNKTTIESKFQTLNFSNGKDGEQQVRKIIFQTNGKYDTENGEKIQQKDRSGSPKMRTKTQQSQHHKQKSQNSLQNYQTQANNNNNNNKDNSKLIDQLILNNLKKQKIQNLIKKQQNQEQKKKQNEKKNELQQKNAEIRTKNAQFSKLNEGEDNKFPWGFNQQKLISNYNSKKELENAKQIQDNRKDDQKHRREQLGLSFLNDKDTTEIEMIRRKQKETIDNNDIHNRTLSEKQKTTIVDQQEHQLIYQFMQFQKKRDEEERMRKRHQDSQRQKKVQVNLQKLQELAREKRKSSIREARSRSFSKKPPNKFQQRSVSGDLYNNVRFHRINFNKNGSSAPGIDQLNSEENQPFYSEASGGVNTNVQQLLYREYQRMVQENLLKTGNNSSPSSKGSGQKKKTQQKRQVIENNAHIGYPIAHQYPPRENDYDNQFQEFDIRFNELEGPIETEKNSDPVLSDDERRLNMIEEYLRQKQIEEKQKKIFKQFSQISQRFSQWQQVTDKSYDSPKPENHESSDDQALIPDKQAVQNPAAHIKNAQNQINFRSNKRMSTENYKLDEQLFMGEFDTSDISDNKSNIINLPMNSNYNSNNPRGSNNHLKLPEVNSNGLICSDSFEDTMRTNPQLDTQQKSKEKVLRIKVNESPGASQSLDYSSRPLTFDDQQVKNLEQIRQIQQEARMRDLMTPPDKQKNFGNLLNKHQIQTDQSAKNKSKCDDQKGNSFQISDLKEPNNVLPFEHKDQNNAQSHNKALNTESNVPVPAELMEESAIIVQKIWRGYQTRQILGLYLEMFQCQNQEEDARSEKSTFRNTVNKGASSNNNKQNNNSNSNRNNNTNNNLNDLSVPSQKPNQFERDEVEQDDYNQFDEDGNQEDGDEINDDSEDLQGDLQNVSKQALIGDRQPKYQKNQTPKSEKSDKNQTQQLKRIFEQNSNVKKNEGGKDTLEERIMKRKREIELDSGNFEEFAFESSEHSSFQTNSKNHRSDFQSQSGTQNHQWQVKQEEDQGIQVDEPEDQEQDDEIDDEDESEQKMFALYIEQIVDDILINQIDPNQVPQELWEIVNGRLLQKLAEMDPNLLQEFGAYIKEQKQSVDVDVDGEVPHNPSPSQLKEKNSQKNSQSSGELDQKQSQNEESVFEESDQKNQAFADKKTNIFEEKENQKVFVNNSGQSFKENQLVDPFDIIDASPCSDNFVQEYDGGLINKNINFPGSIQNAFNMEYPDGDHESPIFGPDEEEEYQNMFKNSNKPMEVHDFEGEYDINNNNIKNDDESMPSGYQNKEGSQYESDIKSQEVQKSNQKGEELDEQEQENKQEKNLESHLSSDKPSDKMIDLHKLPPHQIKVNMGEFANLPETKNNIIPEENQHNSAQISVRSHEWVDFHSNSSSQKNFALDSQRNPNMMQMMMQFNSQEYQTYLQRQLNQHLRNQPYDPNENSAGSKSEQENENELENEEDEEVENEEGKEQKNNRINETNEIRQQKTNEFPIEQNQINPNPKTIIYRDTYVMKDEEPQCVSDDDQAQMEHYGNELDNSQENLNALDNVDIQGVRNGALLPGFERRTKSEVVNIKHSSSSSGEGDRSKYQRYNEYIQDMSMIKDDEESVRGGGGIFTKKTHKDRDDSSFLNEDGGIVDSFGEVMLKPEQLSPFVTDQWRSDLKQGSDLQTNENEKKYRKNQENMRHVHVSTLEMEREQQKAGGGGSGEQINSTFNDNSEFNSFEVDNKTNQKQNSSSYDDMPLQYKQNKNINKVSNDSQQPDDQFQSDINLNDTQELRDQFEMEIQNLQNGNEEMAYSEENSQFLNNHNQSSELNERVILKKNLEVTMKIQEELFKFKEDQAKKWNDMLHLLGNLQANRNLNQETMEYLNELVRQTESNKQTLVSEIKETMNRSNQSAILLSGIFKEAESDYADYQDNGEPNSLRISKNSITQNPVLFTEHLSTEKQKLGKNLNISENIFNNSLEQISEEDSFKTSQVSSKGGQKSLGLRKDLVIDISKIEEDYENEKNQVESGQINELRDIMNGDHRINQSDLDQRQNVSQDPALPSRNIPQPRYVPTTQSMQQLQKGGDSLDLQRFQQEFLQNLDSDLEFEEIKCDKEDKLRNKQKIKEDQESSDQQQNSANNNEKYQNSKDLNDKRTYQEVQEQAIEIENEYREYLDKRKDELNRTLIREMANLDEMFVRNQLSPRSYKKQKTHLEKVVKTELTEIDRIMQELQVHAQQQKQEQQMIHQQSYANSEQERKIQDNNPLSKQFEIDEDEDYDIEERHLESLNSSQDYQSQEASPLQFRGKQKKLGQNEFDFPNKEHLMKKKSALSEKQLISGNKLQGLDAEQQQLLLLKSSTTIDYGLNQDKRSRDSIYIQNQSQSSNQSYFPHSEQPSSVQQKFPRLYEEQDQQGDYNQEQNELDEDEEEEEQGLNERDAGQKQRNSNQRYKNQTTTGYDNGLQNYLNESCLSQNDLIPQKQHSRQDYISTGGLSMNMHGANILGNSQHNKTSSQYSGYQNQHPHKQSNSMGGIMLGGNKIKMDSVFVNSNPYDPSYEPSDSKARLFNKKKNFSNISASSSVPASSNASSVKEYTGKYEENYKRDDSKEQSEAYQSQNESHIFLDEGDEGYNESDFAEYVEGESNLSNNSSLINKQFSTPVAKNNRFNTDLSSNYQNTNFRMSEKEMAMSGENDSDREPPGDFNSYSHHNRTLEQAEVTDSLQFEKSIESNLEKIQQKNSILVVEDKKSDQSDGYQGTETKISTPFQKQEVSATGQFNSANKQVSTNKKSAAGEDLMKQNDLQIFSPTQSLGPIAGVSSPSIELQMAQRSEGVVINGMNDQEYEEDEKDFQQIFIYTDNLKMTNSQLVSSAQNIQNDPSKAAGPANNDTTASNKKEKHFSSAFQVKTVTSDVLDISDEKRASLSETDKKEAEINGFEIDDSPAVRGEDQEEDLPIPANFNNLKQQESSLSGNHQKDIVIGKILQERLEKMDDGSQASSNTAFFPQQKQVSNNFSPTQIDGNPKYDNQKSGIHRNNNISSNSVMKKKDAFDTGSDFDMKRKKLNNGNEIFVHDELYLQEDRDHQGEILTEFLFHNLIEQFAEELENSEVQKRRIRKRSQNSDEPENRHKAKGIRTSILNVKQYLKKVAAYLETHHQKEFIKHLNIELGPRPIEMLRFLHSDIQFESSNDSIFQHQAIVNTQVYQSLEKNIIDEQLMDKLNHIPHSEFAKELQHIHNKVIFDALNESLDSYRVYGLTGRPFPWQIDPSHLKEQVVKEEEFDRIMKKAIDKVIEWSSSLCGIIFDQDQASNLSPELQLDQEYINQIKEDRLAQMLAAEVVEAEDRWIVYDDEQTEVGVELGDLVFDDLVKQLLEEIVQKKVNLLIK